MSNITLTDKQCIECKGKISEYEAKEYKGRCIDCFKEKSEQRV